MVVPAIGAILGAAARALLSEGAATLAARGGASAGGRVIAGMGPGTGNARTMTAMLAGQAQGGTSAGASPFGRVKTVAEEIKGLTIDERMARARKAGSLLTMEQYEKTAPKFTGRTLLEESEHQEQLTRKKEQAAEEEAISNQKASVWKALKQIFLVPGGFVLAFFTLRRGMEKFGESILEGSRDLRKFNGSIDASFALLDRQELVLAGRTAQATAGSTSTLAGSIQSLREESQPMREAWGSLKNLGGALAIQMSRAMTLAVQAMPMMQLLFNVLRLAERWLGGGQPADTKAVEDFLGQAARGGFGWPNGQLGPLQGPRPNAPPIGGDFF